MPFTKEDKAAVIGAYAHQDGDTGSTEVQLALLTERIKLLSKHLTANKQDTGSHRGLLTLVGKRKRMLSYLQRTDKVRYKTLIDKLGLRK